MRDYRYYQRQRELTAQRARQDARDAAVHAQFDRQAQDRVAKFERPRFAVVGEASRAAQDAYRHNYDQIRWDDAVATPDLRQGAAPPRTRRVVSSPKGAA